MINRFLHSIDTVSERVGQFVSFFIIVVALIIGYEVVSRYVFNNPTEWAHETSTMFFAAAVILGGAYTLLHGAHVSMDMIYTKLPVKTRAILDIITFFLFAFFCGVLLWGGGRTGWNALLTLERASTNWEPPIYPFKLLLPVGAFLLLLQGVAKLVRDIVILTKKESG